MDTEKLKQVFDSMDADNSGSLSRRELVDCCIAMGQNEEDAKASVYVSISVQIENYYLFVCFTSHSTARVIL